MDFNAIPNEVRVNIFALRLVHNHRIETELDNFGCLHLSVVTAETLITESKINVAQAINTTPSIEEYQNSIIEFYQDVLKNLQDRQKKLIQNE